MDTKKVKIVLVLTGLRWIPSCAHVITSRSSSSVPYPPTSFNFYAQNKLINTNCMPKIFVLFIWNDQEMSSTR